MSIEIMEHKDTNSAPQFRGRTTDSGEQLRPLTLLEIETLLKEKRVERGDRDDRNPLQIASSLGLIQLVEVDRVASGYFDKIDQNRMIIDGKIIEAIAYGQRVLQAVAIDDTIR